METAVWSSAKMPSTIRYTERASALDSCEVSLVPGLSLVLGKVRSGSRM